MNEINPRGIYTDLKLTFLKLLTNLVSQNNPDKYPGT
jgi:hypothetical protein